MSLDAAPDAATRQRLSLAHMGDLKAFEASAGRSEALIAAECEIAGATAYLVSALGHHRAGLVLQAVADILHGIAADEDIRAGRALAIRPTSAGA